MWAVHEVRGDLSQKTTTITRHTFSTKREAFKHAMGIPHTFIGRINHIYTIYVKK